MGQGEGIGRIGVSGCPSDGDQAGHVADGGAGEPD